MPRAAQNSFMLCVERLPGYIAANYLEPLATERFHGLGTFDAGLFTGPGIQRLLDRLSKANPPAKKPREMARPAAVDNQIERKKEQFFLRSLFRVQRQVDEEMPFKVEQQRDPDAEVLVSKALPRRYQRPQLLTHSNMADVIWWRRFIRELFFEEDWRRHFGRELRESLNVAVWRHHPDAKTD